MPDERAAGARPLRATWQMRGPEAA